MPLSPSLRRPFARGLWLLALGLLLARPALALEALLPVDGLVQTGAGGPVADGKYTLTFRIYADLVANKPLWTMAYIDVPVQGGHFRVVLGQGGLGEPIPTGLFTQHPAAVLGVQVSTEPELPRARLHAVPYALHAATADALAGGLSGEQLAPGSVQAAALGFAYAGSKQKGGPALGLDCTGCIGPEHLAADALIAKKVQFASPLAEKNVQDALLPLVVALRAEGSRVGVGKKPANVCAFDLGTDDGEACLNGAPALWTRFAASQPEMEKLAQEGQLVYRKDTKAAWMRVGDAWRQIAFKVVCGDGVLEAPEECDAGAANADAPDQCRTTCKKPVCGDTIQDGAEACDDGNAVATDGCIACQKAKCGDGFVQAGVEACDGANLGGATCVSAGAGTSGPLGCKTDCSAFDTSGCVKTPGLTPESAAASCQAILAADPQAKSGLYWLKTGSLGTFQAYCDQVTAGGGWLLSHVSRNSASNVSSWFPNAGNGSGGIGNLPKAVASPNPAWATGPDRATRTQLWQALGGVAYRATKHGTSNQVLLDVTKSDFKDAQVGMFCFATGCNGSPAFSQTQRGVVTVVGGSQYGIGTTQNYYDVGDYNCNCSEALQVGGSGAGQSNGYGLAGDWDTEDGYTAFWIR